MEFNMEWNTICRICLHESDDMRSIFDNDIDSDASTNVLLIDKIRQCSTVFIKKGMNMPEQMCLHCVNDLESAYRFRTNCESSDAILQTFTEAAGSSSNQNLKEETQSAIYKFKPPSGLKIKRICKKIEDNSNIKLKMLSEEQDEPNSQSEIQYQTNETIKCEIVPNDDCNIGSDNVTEILHNDPLEEIDYENYDVMDEYNLNKYEEIEEEVEVLENNNNCNDDDGDDDDNNIIEYDNNDTSIDNFVISETYVINEVNSESEETDVLKEAEKNIYIFTDKSKTIPPKQENDTNHINKNKQFKLLNTDVVAGNSLSNNVTSLPTINTVQVKQVKTNKARLNKLKYKKTDDYKMIKVFPVRKQSNEKKALKVCEICGNTYKYKHALDSHMRRHRNEKPFICVVCGKGFVINFELSRHMRTHTGHKPYQCHHCDRKFSDFGSRMKHERTHTGERPYECETCGKCFAYSHVLSSHNLIHTGEKKYRCEKCDKRFAKSHHLKVHYKTHEKRLAKLNQLPQAPFISPSEEELLIQTSTTKTSNINIRLDHNKIKAESSSATPSKHIKQNYLPSNIDKQHVLLSQNGQFVASASVFKDVMTIISSSTTNIDDVDDDDNDAMERDKFDGKILIESDNENDYIEECIDDDDGVDVSGDIIDNNQDVIDEIGVDIDDNIEYIQFVEDGDEIHNINDDNDILVN